MDQTACNHCSLIFAQNIPISVGDFLHPQPTQTVSSFSAFFLAEPSFPSWDTVFIPSPKFLPLNVHRLIGVHIIPLNEDSLGPHHGEHCPNC